MAVYLVVAGFFSIHIVAAERPEFAAALQHASRHAVSQTARHTVALGDWTRAWIAPRSEPAWLDYPLVAPLPPKPVQAFAQNAPVMAVAQKPVRAAAVGAPVFEALRPEPQEAQAVRERLLANLSSPLYAHFDLFLYVSKAERGTWAQRMYVFVKQDGGLDLLHAWPVSTGREIMARNPDGQLLSTATPAGTYQFDPARFHRDYRSAQWGTLMPHAMFFNWVEDGMPTGLAIHGLVDEEIALLGSRASAGCIRLAPQAARTLFRLIRGNFGGRVPRFAYDSRTHTLSNRGELARTRNGNLRFTSGYRVLVFIENYNGDEWLQFFGGVVNGSSGMALSELAST